MYALKSRIVYFRILQLYLYLVLFYCVTTTITMVHPKASAIRQSDNIHHWYTRELLQIPPKTLDLLVNYSKIPFDQVLDHVSRIVGIMNG